MAPGLTKSFRGRNATCWVGVPAHPLPDSIRPVASRHRRGHQPRVLPGELDPAPVVGPGRPHLAGRPGPQPVAGEQRDGRVGVLGVDQRDHPDTAVEGLLEVGLAARRRRCATRSKTGGGVHVARSSRTASSTGSTRSRLAARPPPVTWAIACARVSRGQREAVAGVDPGRRQQLLAEGAAELGDVAVERPASRPVGVRAARAGPASSRWSAARSTRIATTTSPGRTRPGPSRWSASTTPVVGAGDVVLVGGQQPGVLGGLAAEQRAAGLARRPRRCP